MLFKQIIKSFELGFTKPFADRIIYKQMETKVENMFACSLPCGTNYCNNQFKSKRGFKS